MSESTQAPPSRKKKLVIAGLGAAAVIVLTAGTFVGINVSNGKTEQLCAEATAAAQSALKAVKTSAENATAARTQADETEGYAQHNGAAALLKGVDTAKTDLTKIKLGGDCDSRDAATSIQDKSAAAKTQAAKLDGATKKLTADVAAYKEAEAKRIADEKAAADAKAAEAKAAEEKAAADAAAEQAANDAAAAAPAPAPAAQPQYAGGGVGYAPAPKTPQYNAPAPAPAPAPYVPAPAPAPAPVTGGGGGWTPPPMGSGGQVGCGQFGDKTFCSGG